VPSLRRTINLAALGAAALHPRKRGPQQRGGIPGRRLLKPPLRPEASQQNPRILPRHSN
jgi:hypothetical protein